MPGKKNPGPTSKGRTNQIRQDHQEQFHRRWIGQYAFRNYKTYLGDKYPKLYVNKNPSVSEATIIQGEPGAGMKL